MDQRKRILDDIKELEDNLVNFSYLEQKYPSIFDLVKRYLRDSYYFLEQGDLYSSFASLEYAHGLLDALLMIENIY